MCIYMYMYKHICIHVQCMHVFIMYSTLYINEWKHPYTFRRTCTCTWWSCSCIIVFPVLCRWRWPQQLLKWLSLLLLPNASLPPITVSTLYWAILSRVCTCTVVIFFIITTVFTFMILVLLFILLLECAFVWNYMYTCTCTCIQLYM